MIVVTAPVESLKGNLRVPGDKSITHRAIMLGAISRGKTEIRDYLIADDSLATINCFKAMGVNISSLENRLIIEGSGSALKQSGHSLNAGNSGTTARLIMGILAGQKFTSRLEGDSSLSLRPMDRVIEPLKKMGASFTGQDNRLPLNITGGFLEGIQYTTRQASAQVKSAILLAGLYTQGVTSVSEPYLSRNHTELLLKQFGAAINLDGHGITLKGPADLRGSLVRVPGDISSAAFFMVAAAIIPGSEVNLLNVGINPTRTGIIDVLKMMGADITITQERKWGNEAVADIKVCGHGMLKGIEIAGSLIPRVIDEIPVLSVAAAVATGKTIIRDAKELRVKETDRIATMVRQLVKMGATLQEAEDGMIIGGGARLKGSKVDSEGDHRVAMSLIVAGLIAEGDTSVYGADALNVSYPRFVSDLRSLVNS